MSCGRLSTRMTRYDVSTRPAGTILHLVTDLRIGGAQKILLDRLRGLPRWRHEVLVFARHTGARPIDGQKRGDFAAALAAAGARIHSLELPRPRDAVRAYVTGGLGRRLARIAQEVDPDLLHSTLFHAHLLGDHLARRLDRPHLASKEGTDTWMGPWERLLEGRALRRADRVAVV